MFSRFKITLFIGIVPFALAGESEVDAPPYAFRDYREAAAGLVTVNGPASIVAGPRLEADAERMVFGTGGWGSRRISYSSLRENLRRSGSARSDLEEAERLPHGGEDDLIPVRPLFTQTLNGEKGKRYLISLRSLGVLATAEGGGSFTAWKNLPRRFVPEDYEGPVLYRDVLDVWQNPRLHRQLLVLNKHDLLQSDDGGESFTKLRLSGVKADETFATLGARAGESGAIEEIFLGTTSNGVLRLRPGPAGQARRQERITQGLPFRPHDGRIIFYEEISGLAVDEGRGRLIATTLFSGSVCVAPLSGGRFQCEAVPGLSGEDSVDFLLYDPDTAVAYAGTNRGVYAFAPEGQVPGTKQAWATMSTGEFYGTTGDESTVFLGRFADGIGRTGLAPFRNNPRRAVPTNLRGFYISPTTASSKRERIYDMVNRYGYNAAVIDVKDDFGRLIYGSDLPDARAMSNTLARAPLREIVAELKKRNIYTIARQVVFKDNHVYAYRGNRYAIRDAGGGPWGPELEERWTDSYSVWVHNYNIRVAREVLALGFDEIQFDYIRFPSDGPIGRCRWSHREGDAYMSEALESFLRKARAKLQAPISVDVYGYNAIYRAGGVIGQDVHDLGDYIDVLSPMHYSSHFGPQYMRDVPRDQRAFALLKLGCERPMRRGRGVFQVRPWLQAFEMMSGTWGAGAPYMQNQILGSLEGGCNGFLFWGPLARFTIPGQVQNRMYGTTDHLIPR